MTTSIRSRKLYLDIESYCECDLKTCGVYRYSEDPTFEVQLFGFAYDDDPVTVIDLAQGEEIPESVLSDLTDPKILKLAYNASFERTCLSNFLKTPMPPEQWYCIMVRASTLGLPAGLGLVGEALHLDSKEQKMSIGKRLIQYFARPCLPTKTNGGRRRNLPYHEPEKWALYKEYNRRDVETERVIYKRLSVYPEMIPTERRLWSLDQKINDNGILIDRQLVENILTYADGHGDRLKERAKEISGLNNVNSLAQVKEWLKANGVTADSLDKEAVKRLINEHGKKTDITEFLSIRQELGKTSVAKYAAVDRAICVDNKLRGTLQFYGANHTGRWCGRIFQTQNLPQNKMKDLDIARRIVKENDFELFDLLYDSPMEVFSQLVRTTLIPSKGKTFVVADYSAIEARVIAWLADEKWALDTFRGDGKIYEATAAQMFHVPIEEVTKDSEYRKKGKIATLACGFGGGVNALRKMDKNGDIPENEKQGIIDAWRNANPHIVAYWKATETAMKDAIAHPGVTVKVGRCRCKLQDGVLFITLPSGRALAYQRPRLEKTGFRTEIKFMGQNQITHTWDEISTYGGRAVENITQATARDCLGAAMLRLDKAGYNIRFHVHDEVIIEVDRNTAEDDMKRVREIMSLKDLEWAAGLPLTADGYICDYYRKD